MGMKLHSTTIVVRDQDEALRFFVELLGWEKDEDAMMGPVMRFLTVKPVGAETAIVLGQPEVYDRQPPGPDAGEGSSGISILTDDIDATYADLSAKGVTFTGPPQTMPWGDRATWFSDPSNNSFFIVEVSQS